MTIDNYKNDESANPIQPRQHRGSCPRWMKWTLAIAAIYNLVWGAWAVMFPNAWFDLAGMARPTYPQIWQCVGMIVGVYGVAYAIAAMDPVKWWPIVLVGLLGKIFGPIGFSGALLREEFPLSMGWTILTNDLIWWVPFALMLRQSWRHHASCRQGA